MECLGAWRGYRRHTTAGGGLALCSELPLDSLCRQLGLLVAVHAQQHDVVAAVTLEMQWQVPAVSRGNGAVPGAQQSHEPSTKLPHIEAEGLTEVVSAHAGAFAVSE